MALRLRNLGLSRVRPLAGGFHAWRSRGYPVEPRKAWQAPASGARAASTSFP